MDMKKIGAFLKELRKEKGMTQEQLAEELGVAGRTVSRWETGSNMPDLSILIRLAEYYDVEVKEILDGERRKKDMQKELKETLEKVADYEEIAKKKVAGIVNFSFGITFMICAAVIVFQLLIFTNLRMVAGETALLIIGGITYLIMIINGGLWDTASGKKRKAMDDLILSVIVSAIFTVLLGVMLLRMSDNLSVITLFIVGFFVGITMISFGILRVLFRTSDRRAKRYTNC